MLEVCVTSNLLFVLSVAPRFMRRGATRCSRITSRTCLFCRQTRTEKRRQATCTVDLVKLGHVVFEIRMRADRQASERADCNSSQL